MAEDRKDDMFSAGWTDNLRHRTDPNRVSDLQIPSSAPFDGQETAPMPADWRDEDSKNAGAEPSYYDIPILKQPVWKWQIASYFFLGGMSAGAYVISRIADRFGGEAYKDMTRMGAYVSLAALTTCPPLLIWDLGDPARFHHMLRVFKPGTPMSLGTWAIVAYSGMAGMETLRRFLSDKAIHILPEQQQTLLNFMNNGMVLLLHDAAGIPFALLVAGYTGVLLSCTANPLWSGNPWLGPLFSASAISTGAAALTMALDLTEREPRHESPSHALLRKVDTVAHMAELACMAGFTRHAGEKARPLTHGSMRKHFLFSVGGILAAEAIKHLPVGRKLRKPVRMAATALGLAAGFSLRWSMVFGGHEAAADPHLCRVASRKDPRTK